MRFLGGFFTGFITVFLVIAIALGILLGAVPLTTIGSWVGLEITEDNPNRDKNVIELAQVAVSMVQHLETTSMNDIKKNFGIDLLAKIKAVAGVPEGNTALDSLGECAFNQISTEAQKIQVGSLLGALNVNFQNADIEAMLKPMLDSTIQNITAADASIVQNTVNSIKLGNIKGLLPDAIPDLPLFAAANDGKNIVDIIGNITETPLSEVIVFEEGNLLNDVTVTVKVKNETTGVMEDKVVKLIDRPIGNIANEAPDAFKNTPLSTFVTIDDKTAPKVLKTLRDKGATLNTVSEILGEITLFEALDITNREGNILNDIKVKVKVKNAEGIEEEKEVSLLDRPIKAIGDEITGAIKNTPIGTFVNVEGTMLGPEKLNIGGCTLNNIATKLDEEIKTLTLAKVLPDATIKGNKLLTKLQGTQVQNIGSEVQNLVVTSNLNDLVELGLLGKDEAQREELKVKLKTKIPGQAKTLGEMNFAEIILAVPTVPAEPDKKPTTP